MLVANQLSENGKIISKVGELLGDIIGNAESCFRQYQALADFLMSLNERWEGLVTTRSPVDMENIGLDSIDDNNEEN